MSDNELKWESTKNYSVDIRTVNPYVFMSHSYQGSGGFYDGSYLNSFARESFYDERKKYSFYRNYLKPMINALVEPVFSKNIIRTTTNDLFDTFLSDVDNAKTDINSFSEMIMTYSRLHGVTFVVMDNFDTGNILTRSEAIINRKLPYVYIQPAYNVSSYKVDDFGNLIEITFKNKVKLDKKDVCLYTTWDSQLTVKEWKDEYDKLIKTEVNYHNLGVIPVISVYSTNTNDILPLPPFYDVAKLNLAVYNKDSEIRDQERSQAFSIFYMQTDSNNNSITLGASNALIIPAGSEVTIPPGYVSPDSTILKTLMENNKELINSIYAIAENQGVIGVQESKSGIAASYKFVGVKDQLMRTVNIAETFEKDLSKMFGLYTNENIDYEVVYPNKFTNIIQKDFNTLKMMLDIETTDNIKKEIKKIMLSEILETLPDDKINILIEELDKTKEQPVEEINNGDTNIR